MIYNLIYERFKYYDMYSLFFLENCFLFRVDPLKQQKNWNDFSAILILCKHIPSGPDWTRSVYIGKIKNTKKMIQQYTHTKYMFLYTYVHTYIHTYIKKWIYMQVSPFCSVFIWCHTDHYKFLFCIEALQRRRKSEFILHTWVMSYLKNTYSTWHVQLVRLVYQCKHKTPLQSICSDISA